MFKFLAPTAWLSFVYLLSLAAPADNAQAYKHVKVLSPVLAANRQVGELRDALATTQIKPQPKQQPVAAKHGRGRKVDQKLVNAKRALSVAKYGGWLKSLPKVTANDYDSRTLGRIPPVLDQGQCGTCWLFSGMASVDVSLIMAGYGPNDGSFLGSEQNFLDCWSSGGCDGDDNTTVLAALKVKGIATTADYGPYQASKRSCKNTSSMKTYMIQDWLFVTTIDQQGVANPQDIMNAVAKFGFVGCGVAADDAFEAYTSGVFAGSGAVEIDHDVGIVGWHIDPSNPANNYWIVRNSWSKTWGEQGYIRMLWTANKIGTEAVASFATSIAPVPPTPPTPPTPPPAGPAITSPLSSTAYVGQSYSYAITANNSPVAFVAIGLPAGLACNPTTGVISGTATAVGTSLVQIDAVGTTVATGTLTLTASNAMGPVTVTLTPDQVQQVISQSGVVTIHKDMSIKDLVDAFQKCLDEKSKSIEPPLLKLKKEPEHGSDQVRPDMQFSGSADIPPATSVSYERGTKYGVGQPGRERSYLSGRGRMPGEMPRQGESEGLHGQRGGNSFGLPHDLGNHHRAFFDGSSWGRLGQPASPYQRDSGVASDADSAPDTDTGMNGG